METRLASKKKKATTTTSEHPSLDTNKKARNNNSSEMDLLHPSSIGNGVLSNLEGGKSTTTSQPSQTMTGNNNYNPHSGCPLSQNFGINQKDL
ncbi:hypothetical protein ACA910_002690 [Epithemia clementina (nom. ined.)]